MTLSPEQQAAVSTSASHVVLSSSAGSGKSRCVCERIKYLISTGVLARNITCVTFTVKAARELQDRLPGIELGFLGTLHSLCLKITRHCHESLALPSVLTVLDESSAEDILNEVMNEQRYTGTKDAARAALAKGPFNFGDSVALTKADLVAKSYYLKLFRAGMLDFDSLLHCALHLFRNGVQTPMPGTHLCADELQDSSVMDHCIYDAFPAANKFYVQDVRQSIYSFRGGSIKSAEALMNRKSVLNLSLTGNYRCASEIVRVANNLIRHNDPSLGNMVSKTGTKGRVEWYQLKDAQAEMKHVATFIRKAQERDNAGNSIAVLLRTNYLVEQFALGLEAYGIPVAKRVQASVADWSRAKKVVAFAANPENDRMALEYIRMVSGDKQAAAAAREARQQLCSVNQAVLQFRANENIDELLTAACIDSMVREGIQKLIQQLPLGSTPNDLLIAMNEIESNSVTVSEGIHVGTIHGAKGLEFDCVILPAFEESVIPGLRKEQTAAVEQEERRLAYVAVTRARHSLILTHSATRKPQFGAHEPVAQSPSRFIREMDI